MSDDKLKQFDKKMLMIEAVLIVISLAIGGNARIGMICYWCIVALYHLTEIVLKKRDGE